MNHNNSPASAILLLLFTVVAAAWGQGAGELPTKDSPKPGGKAGHLRVWHFAPGIEPRIDIGISGAGQKPVPIGRSMAYGRRLTYEKLRPGKYNLHVTPFETAPAQSETSDQVAEELLRPFEVTVTDGSFQTAILHGKGNQSHWTVLDDTFRAEPSSAKRLRLFHFVPGENPALKLPSGQLFMDQVPQGYVERIIHPRTQIFSLTLVRLLEGGREGQQIIDLDYKHAKSASLIIMLDRYGRTTMEVVEDATLPPDAP